MSDTQASLIQVWLCNIIFYIDLYIKFTVLTLQWNLTVQELKLMSMHLKRIDKQPHSDESQRRWIQEYNVHSMPHQTELVVEWNAV